MQHHWIKYAVLWLAHNGQYLLSKLLIGVGMALNIAYGWLVFNIAWWNALVIGIPEWLEAPWGISIVVGAVTFGPALAIFFLGASVITAIFAGLSLATNPTE